MSEQLYRWVKPTKETEPTLEYASLQWRNTETKLPISSGLAYMTVSIKQRYDDVEMLEAVPSPGDNQSLEDIAKRYNIDLTNYVGDQCGLSHDEWQLEQIVDKIREMPTLEAIGLVRRLAGAAYVKGGEGLVDELRKLNPYQSETKEGWKKCCDKLKELLTQQK